MGGTSLDISGSTSDRENRSQLLMCQMLDSRRIGCLLESTNTIRRELWRCQATRVQPVVSGVYSVNCADDLRAHALD